jgi:hypothetical protein
MLQAPTADYLFDLGCSTPPMHVGVQILEPGIHHEHHDLGGGSELLGDLQRRIVLAPAEVPGRLR